MKRNYPYTGPKSQAQAAQQQPYAQPPPPAGPAPPLPSSGGPPQQAAYANYGYGSVAPPRHAAAPMNSVGAADAAQQQWNQQWQQPQQYYPQPQQPNTPGPPAAGGQFAAPRPSAQSGPYRPMATSNARSPSLNQNAAYSPHHPQQPLPYSYQSQASPSQHHQPPAPPSYGYTPPLPQHQNPAPPNNANAQNWPGAYSSGSQVGPPNKKPRYQAPSAPVSAPTPPYVQPGVAPIPPIGGNMAARPMGPFPGPNPVNPPSQQPYAWQGPNPAPAPHMNPQPLPGHQGPQGRMPSAGGFQVHLPGRSGPAAHHGKGDKGGKGPGLGNGPANVAGRGMNRNGPQNRGNIQQASSAQRAALPANPNASVNAARAQNGQTRTWGSNANPGNQNTSAGPGAAGGFQAGRRASAASSVHSDKNVGGLGKKTGPGAQILTPPNAPRGPSNAKNKAGKVVPMSSATGSQALKNGSAVAAQAARGPGTAPNNAMSSGTETDVRSQDPNSTSAAVAAKEGGASSKRAHTDFRILGLEIKELNWSWFAPQALPKKVVAGDEIKTESADSTQDLAQIKTEEDEVSAQAEQTADVSADVEAGANAAPSANGDADDDGDDRVEEEDQNAKAKQEDDEKQDDGDEHSEYGDADADADADGEGEEDAEAEAEAAADAPADADADAEEKDITMSHADTDTVASNPQQSVAPTLEPSSEPSKALKAEALKVKSSKAERAKAMANLRDSTKLRFCFAAMSNAGPEGAPTGPKAQIQEQATVEAESSVQNEATEQKPAVEAKDNSGDAKVEIAEAVRTKAEEEAENEEHLNDPSEQNGSAVAEEVTDANEAEITDAPKAAQSDVQDQASAMEEPAQPADGETAASAEETKVQQSEETSNETEQTKDATAASPAKTKKTRPATEAVPSAKGPPQLSLNRIFLSFAANRKRLAIDAEAIKSVRIHRSEHWVEIRIDASRSNEQIAARKKGEEYLMCRGTLLERRGKGQENYTAVTRADIASVWESAEADVKADQTAEAGAGEEDHLELPPFFRLPDSELTLVVKLDPSAPLPEPTWLRKNDVASLLANLQRGSSAIAGQSETAISVGTAQHVWAGKIQVVDPDPPPSMSTFLYEWVKESFVGGQKERRRFVDELLSPATSETAEQGGGEKDRRVARGFVEIVLRLVRGERVTATTTGGFARAIESATMTNSTTYPGLVMLGLLEIALDNTNGDAGKVRKQVDGLLMEFPRATLVKAVDLTWKDVVEAGRKGGGNALPSGVSSSAGASGGKGGNQKTRQQHFHHHGNRQGHPGQGGSGGGRYGGKRKRG